MYANNLKTIYFSKCLSVYTSLNVNSYQAKTFSLTCNQPYNLSLSKSFLTPVSISSLASVHLGNIPSGGGVTGELNIESSLSNITSDVSYKKVGVLNPVSDISGINTSGISLFKIGGLHILAPIGATYGEQYWQDVPFEDVGEFMTDVYSIRYLTKNSVVDRKDVVRVLKSLSNLLRNCYEYDINEVFLGTIRIKKVKDSNYYVIVEY